MVLLLSCLVQNLKAHITDLETNKNVDVLSQFIISSFHEDPFLFKKKRNQHFIIIKFFLYLITCYVSEANTYDASSGKPEEI